jgi:uncharacterized protein
MAMEAKVLYHEKAGVQNTEPTLAAAQRRAAERGIRQLVVATTTGQTALACAERMPEMERIVGVTMHAVDEEIFVERPSGRVRAPDPETMEKARARGVVFYTGVHSLRGAVSSAIHDRYGGVQAVDIIADTYRTFSTGMKVAVECVLMAADARRLDMRADTIALGGWRGGADTAVVVRPAYTHHFFDLRVREVIAMPRDGG